MPVWRRIPGLGAVAGDVRWLLKPMAQRTRDIVVIGTSSGGVNALADLTRALPADLPAAVFVVMHVAPLVAQLSGQEVPPEAERPVTQELEVQVGFAKSQGHMADMKALGTVSRYTCPECGGALWELKEGPWKRYLCHAGHGYSAEALLEGQTKIVEEAMYEALRAVQEKAEMLRRMAKTANPVSADLSSRYTERAVQLEAHALLLQDLLRRGVGS